jgi:hypothetical protein
MQERPKFRILRLPKKYAGRLVVARVVAANDLLIRLSDVKTFETKDELIAHYEQLLDDIRADSRILTDDDLYKLK